jgi:hypothetical protein
MGRDKDDDAAKKAAEAMKKQEKAVRKTENQINKGSHVCGCGKSFGSALLLDIHMMGCDG